MTISLFRPANRTPAPGSRPGPREDGSKAHARSSDEPVRAAGTHPRRACRLAPATFALAVAFMLGAHPETPPAASATSTFPGTSATLAVGDPPATPVPGGAPAQDAPAFTLVSAEPAPGSWVTDPPPRLVLQFSEAVDPARSRVTVSSYRQGNVPGRLEGAGSDTVRFIPEIALEEATYEVTWRVTSAAGSPEEGSYHFTYLVPQEDWEEALDRRLINRLLGNLVPGWVLVIPALAGIGGIGWVFWQLFRR